MVITEVLKLLEIYKNDKLELFCNKHNIDVDSLDWLGKGDFGEAYLINNSDKVLKITTSKSEFKIAQELIGKSKQFSSFAEFFVAEKIGNSMFIIVEYLEIDSKIEDLYYRVEDILQSQGLQVQYIDMFDEDEYIENNGEIDPNVSNFLNELSGIVYNYQKLGILASDIRPENMGYDKNGNLKAFDIENRSR